MIKSTSLLLTVFLFLIMTAALFPDEIFHPAEIYLVPQTIYVGDKGRLIIPLGPAFAEADAFVTVAPNELPEQKDLVIGRIELEKRNNNIRLLIDFVSYAPGTVSLPSIKIPPAHGAMGSETFILEGIEFNVASILTPESMVLSPPALPIAAPGTALLVYGGLGVLLLLLICGITALLYFRRFFDPLLKRLKERRFLASLEKKIMFLRSPNSAEDPVTSNELFSLLAGEFREFLSFLSGINCSALTAFEFAVLPLEIPGNMGPEYFSGLFRRWDALRFSGSPALRKDMLGILDDIMLFFSGLKDDSYMEKNP